MKLILACCSTLLLLSPLGCGGSSVPESTTTLTKEQAQLVALTLSDTLSDATEPVTKNLGNPKGMGALLDTGTVEVDTTKDCVNAGTGTKSVTGTVSMTENSATSAVGTFNFTRTFDHCQLPVQAGSSDELIIDGTVTATGNININGSAQTGEISTTTTGTLAVSGDSVKPGDCGISANLSAAVDADSFSLGLNGSICDRSIDFNASVSRN